MMFRRSQRSGQLSMFFATDFHGSTLTFRKFLAAPRFYQADVLVLGGDLTGKALYPVLPADRDRVRDDPDLQQQAETTGIYLWEAQPDEVEQLKADISYERKVVAALACERLERWLHRGEEVLAETDTDCYVIGGNDDSEAVVDLLASHPGPRIRFCEDQTLDFGRGRTITGYGWANPTPWATPRELTDPDIAAGLRAAIATCPDPARAVFSIHVPPYEVLDVCPKLDTSVDPPRPVIRGGQVVTASVGSHAVREAILQTQPLLMLCGHIHESRGAVRLGRSLVVNPGSEFSQGLLNGVRITVSDHGKLDYQLTSG
jgi:Icc-related predicted phosphoesterase